MAAITSAVVVAAGSAYAANKQAGAAKAAANKGKYAADAAAQQLEDNYQRTATNLNPYIEAGQGALTGLNNLANGDYSGFKNSPDYQASLQMGLQGLDRSAASRGSLYSGGQQADVVNYAGSLASQNLNSYRNSLMGLAQLGQSSASGLGSIGNGSAAQAGSFGLQGAQLQANGAYDQANSQANLVNGLAGAFGQYMGNRGTTNASSYQPIAGSGSFGLTGGTYTGGNSLSTAWPGSTGANTSQYSTSWPGMTTGWNY